jgi:chemotaxis protein methyltransferase CheR
MLLIVEDITKELKQRYAVNLNAFNSSLLISKINKRMSSLGISIQQTYLDHFRKDPDEATILLQEIGINVSSFFRNPMVYTNLEQNILPEIIKDKRKKGLNEIRVWSAGCSSGEEPYSVAILLHQLLNDETKQWQIHIFATDIDQEILNKAVKGVFTRDQLLDTKLGICDEYFNYNKGKYTLKPGIRKMVNFSFDDLASPEKIAPAASIFGSFDLVLCRNVLIYFNASAKQRAIQKTIKTLNRSGYLILGESEWMADKEQSAFIEKDHKNRIYKKK